MTENYAKEFHEATAKEGDVWHEVVSVTPKPRCSCGKMFMWQADLFKHIDESNPTYDNPRDIFKRMKEYCGEEKFEDFIWELNRYQDCHRVTDKVYIEYILYPAALCKKAWEFITQNKGEK